MRRSASVWSEFVLSVWEGKMNRGARRRDIQTAYPEIACAGEVVTVLVEGQSHNAVCGVEGLLHAVAVVDVNVDVQHTPVRPFFE